jgi:predicted DNA-binding transcriptional regulator YafY
MNTERYRQIKEQYEQLKFAKNYDHLKESIEGPIRPQTIEAITNCINNRWRLNFSYIGDKETSPGRRWIEPYCYGISKFTGNTLLRGFVYQGTSVSNHEPMWRTFRLDRILSTAVLSKTPFNRPQPDFNPNGDGLLSAIILMIQFPD